MLNGKSLYHIRRLPNGIFDPQRSFPKLIPQDDKIVFLFEATDAFYRDLAEYNGGALVNASKFAMTIKALKSQIIGLKMNKGKSYVERKEKGE